MLSQQPTKVLVVDDDSVVRLVLHDAVERLGAAYDVDTAENGQQALRKLAQGAYDLVITDLRLPDLDGIALTERIRAQDQCIPIIWITACADDTMSAEAIRLNIYCCLHKPLEISTIRITALAALQRGP